MIERISKYRIDSILGHGAMGLVYKATDEAINRTVAIKTIHPHLLLDEAGAELIKRFKTEATAAARCQHHNIVSIYDFGQHEETPFIVMEFVKGQGLDRLLKALTPISLERISSILLGICAGLAYAHQQNIVHRDIKPANIIVLDDYTVKVADFGIAKIETSEMTQIGLTLGTASYMAPEQSAGLAIDCRVDIYAFGVVAFELFSLCSDLPAELCQYSITSNIEANKAKKINLLAPVVKGRKGHYRELFEDVRKKGFSKVRIDGEIVDITPKMQVDRYKIHDIEIVIDETYGSYGEEREEREVGFFSVQE